MSSDVGNSLYADSDPHYTPEWLSKKIAGLLPTDLTGTVVDPACGAGNLLVAAASILANGHRIDDLAFMGIDVSQSAVDACSSALSSLLDRDRFTVKLADFLSVEPRQVGGVVTVLMNPPFKGYGHLEPKSRSQIASQLNMSGRFNLSHAFVLQALTVYSPGHLVALLPSNWIYSRASRFRQELDLFGGSWEWEDVGSAFPGLSVDVGILQWWSKQSREKVDPVERRSFQSGNGIRIRQGVATGRDSAFVEIAAKPPPFGNVVDAIRGRDVDRSTSRRIWIPTSTPDSAEQLFRSRIDSTLVKELESRSCVQSGRRLVFQYHDPIPSWFLEHPKLLVPEIVSGKIRVELDSEGSRLPLHSVIAIRVRNADEGERMKEYLEASAQQDLLPEAPRLAGGARRLQVRSLGEAVSRWWSAKTPC